MKARISKNLVGPQVRRLRCQRNWTQEELADKMQDMGCDVGRTHIAKVEAGAIWVSDIEYLLYVKVFCARLEDLLPRMDNSQSLFIVLTQLTGGQLKMLMSPEAILAKKSIKLLNAHKIDGHEICPELGTKSNFQKRRFRHD